MADQENSTKTCRRCKADKPACEFGREPKHRDGLTSHCRQCMRDTSNAWKARNRDRVLAYAKAYAAAIPVEVRREKDRMRALRHPGRTSKASRAWEKANPEKVAARKLEWKRLNRDKVNELGRRHYWKDPIKAAAKAHRRRVLMLDGGLFSAADVADIHKMQRGKCAICRGKLCDGYQIDHIIPLSKGGRNDRRNLQLACKSCNASKSARDPLEFMRSRGRLL